MPITIRGIRITDLSLKPNEDGEEKITCSYALISTADKVLANQSIGGYNGMKLSPSLQTQKALEEFLRLYKNDVHVLLGLDAE